ncbi:hypothetical protein HanLR1_Chr16g0621691 [Helianthus annuus]|nr:hypothetical protein HanLR1_Chr16g0621691 [Helianthus annuus]
MEPVHATPHRAFVFIRRILFDAHGVSELVHIMRRRAFVLIGRSSRTELADGARTAYRSLCTSCAAARLCLSDGACTACRSLCTPCAAARLCLSDGARTACRSLCTPRLAMHSGFFLLRTSSFFCFL